MCQILLGFVFIVDLDFYGSAGKARQVTNSKPKYLKRGYLQEKSLNQTTFSKRQSLPNGHDEMIQHPHIYQAQSLFERIGQQTIRLARFRNSGRVVVSKDHRCCIV